MSSDRTIFAQFSSFIFTDLQKKSSSTEEAMQSILIREFFSN